MIRSTLDGAKRRRKRSHLSRADCLLVFERFAKIVQREGEGSASVIFGHAPSGQIDVTFRVLGSFGVGDDMFEAIRVLAGYKLAK